MLIIGAAGAPWLSPFNPNEQFFDGLTLEGSPLPPSERFWFGTDTLGRDQFSRVLYGAGTSLIIGILANGAAVLIGTLLGVTAGYIKGIAGAAIMRFTDLMMAFPALLLGIALASLLKPSLFIVALVIALVNWVQIARVVYAQTLALSEREFVEAARALGSRALADFNAASGAASRCRPCSSMARSASRRPCSTRRHLSFLGVGVQPPDSVLGQDDLRKPELLSHRALARVHSWCCDPDRGACLQSRRRWVARCARSHADGGAADAASISPSASPPPSSFFSA